MNKLFCVILIIGLHLVMNMFLPWWNIAIASGIAVLLTRVKGVLSFLLPAITISILWGIWILILDQKTGFYSSERIADLFEAPGVLAFAIPIAGAFLIAGIGGMIANLLSNVIKTKTAETNQMDLEDYKMTQPDLDDKDLI